MGAGHIAENLAQLDQKKLGDKKLSKEEKGYLEKKDSLWVKDIQDKLLIDIRATNKLAWSKNAPQELDAFIKHPEQITPFIMKEDGITAFTDALAKTADIDEKRSIVLNFLLSALTKNFQSKYDLTNGFNYDTVKLIFQFQKEHKIPTDCVFGKGMITTLMNQMHGEGNNNAKNTSDTPLVTKDGQQINVTEMTPFHECAEYVIDSMMKTFSWGKKNMFTNITGVAGNAWTMYDNINSKMGKSLYNAFSDASIPGDILQDSQKIKEYVETTCADMKDTLNVKTLKKGDVIGLYYPKSSNHLKAAQGCQSGTCNTHVGYVRDIAADGTPIISHNVHGTVFNQPATELVSTKNISSCMITWAARPNLSRMG